MRWNPVRVGIGALAWTATLAGAAGVGLHFSRSSSRLLVLAASGAPYLMGSALVGVAIFAAGRRWGGAGLAGVVAAAGIWTQAPLYTGGEGDDQGRTVTVMQANLLFDGADPRALVDEVRAREVEILTVDELTPAAVAALGRTGLDEALPHRYLSPGRTATGTGIWSSHPLSDTVEYDGFVLNQLSATAAIPEIGPVAVYAFHPVPPVYGTQVWADELSRLRAILERAPAGRPVLVGGDFNATYDHAQYRALASGRFADAAVQAGAGHLVTYPTDKRWPPLVGIDHILTAGGRAVAVETVGLPGADHRALVARIQLSKRDIQTTGPEGFR
ncbi:endonuclease/exonuclease/phosphatase family protein [Nocardia zapadnayensis]|uniref:endonuclease/exonuclease/phosphatase family protein n=1 Tax=Nocardia rhamnosiphila TaxID=426716 RepID=UPI00224719DE|nr:endonuclease/exonuclease/phosphatase family protein [Nocardia zapadnayensis]MCX0273325.1 endonuclease/exonuclease/phosphatase family protein [Nocardia zapadnayensis]